MKRLISIDGLDGCGKTTIGTKLAKRISGIYYYTPPIQIHPIREIADRGTPAIRAHYYMFGNLVASQDFKSLLQNSHVISDRYIYATKAYHEVLGVMVQAPEELLLPDAVIYIKASWEIMKERLDKRFGTSPYEDMDYLKKVAIHYENILSGISNVIIVDSTDREADDVVDEIISRLDFLDL